VTDLYTLHRLATELRLPRAWLRQEALAGRLPCLSAGRKLLFSRAAVERALSERAATAHARSIDVSSR
jgi:hypothetical protein